MEADKICKLLELARTHNQFTNEELFVKVAMKMQWSYGYAKKMVGSHCNVLSSWIILNAYGVLDTSYEDFFYWGVYTDVYDETNMYTAKAWKDDGYMNVRFKWICKAIGVNIEPEYLSSYGLISDASELPDNVFYQTVIRGHFMASYVEENKIFLADTSSRGIGVPAEDTVTRFKFKYLTKLGA